MKGKPQKIDLLKLYANTDVKQWNTFLSTCLAHQDLHALEKTLYGLQLGMNDLVKKKLNTDKMNAFFIRLQRSVENTIKGIIKAKEPHPLDNAFNKEKYVHLIDAKRQRDQDIERFLRKVRF